MKWFINREPINEEMWAALREARREADKDWNETPVLDPKNPLPSFTKETRATFKSLFSHWKEVSE